MWLGITRPMNLHRTIVGISALLAIHPAQVGPPFVRDDPEPPPPGGWEINIVCNVNVPVSP
jgi:hypothetical protein